MVSVGASRHNGRRPVARRLALGAPGITVGVLGLVGFNALPLVDMKAGVGQLRPPDIAFIALVAVATPQGLLAPSSRRLPPAKVAIPCVAFGLWWLFVF